MLEFIYLIHSTEYLNFRKDNKTNFTFFFTRCTLLYRAIKGAPQKVQGGGLYTIFYQSDDRIFSNLGDTYSQNFGFLLKGMLYMPIPAGV